MNAGNESLLTAINESLRIVEEYGNLEIITSHDRAILRAWQRELQATVFMLQTIQGNAGEALAGARVAFTEDPRWILDLCRCGTQAVSRRIRTLFRSVLANAKK